MSLTSIFLIGFSFFCTDELHFVEKQKEAKLILDQLYEVVGNYTFPKPDLILKTTEKSVASYSPYSNTIVLEEKAFDICAKLGEGKKNALAFILGHELGHGFASKFEDEKHETNFLSFDKHEHCSKSSEENADLFGCFTAYLAGFEIDNVVSETLDFVYTDYDLKDKTLSNYPSLYERMKSSDRILLKVKELVAFYEIAPALDIAGHYNLSKSCYKYITDFYQGKEIYNNLGISYLQEAINISDTNIDKYAFPFEIDKESRLKRPFGDKGGKSLNYKEQILRDVLLGKAIKQFETAIDLDNNYELGYSNKIVALSLQKNHLDALAFAKKARNMDAFKNSNLIKLSTALAYLSTEKEDLRSKGQKFLKELLNANDQRISQLAAVNLSIDLDESYEYASSCECQSEEFPSSMSLLHKMNKEDLDVELDEYLNFTSVVNEKKNKFGLTNLYQFKAENKIVTVGYSDVKKDHLCDQILSNKCGVNEKDNIIIDPMYGKVIYVNSN